jgi:hypothetical protein
MASKRPPRTPSKNSKPKVSKARTPPFENYPAWSTAKFWGFLRSGLRSTYNRWPPKWDVLNKAKRPYEGKDKRQKWEFQCGECAGWFKSTEVSVDHIVPAGSLNTFEDIAGFVERLFVGPEGLQCLCKACHDRKTLKERNEK